MKDIEKETEECKKNPTFMTPLFALLAGELMKETKKQKKKTETQKKLKDF